MKNFGILMLALTFLIPADNVLADDADIAKQLSNPLASLISVPFQLNRDTGFGTRDGEKTTLNIQPVIPFALTPNLNLITRTIIPYKWQTDIGGTTGTESGWGDTTMSFWLSPSHDSFTWGGPDRLDHRCLPRRWQSARPRKVGIKQGNGDIADRGWGGWRWCQTNANQSQYDLECRNLC